MKNLLLSLMLIFSTTAMTCTEDGTGGIVEDNDLRIPVSQNKSGLSEAQFNEVITKLETIYAPIVSSMKGKLDIKRLWKDEKVNASAMRKGSTWEVNMYGGLARHQAITADGFALVLCHEIGHHLGGAPKRVMLFSKWASNEGQADYFAALKCLRQNFLNDDNAAVVSSMKVPATLSNACGKQYKNTTDKNMCIRIGMAGSSVANLFAAIRKQPEPKFDTPDPAVVTKTYDMHPAFQCRLDTYFQGSLCEVGMNEEVSQSEEVKGTCHATLGHKTGLRPLCWFKPKAI